MAIIESSSSPDGTHPSRASSMTRIKCDKCGDEFTADCCIDDQWQLHGETVGATLYDGNDAEEWCADCVSTLTD